MGANVSTKQAPSKKINVPLAATDKPLDAKEEKRILDERMCEVQSLTGLIQPLVTLVREYTAVKLWTVTTDDYAPWPLGIQHRVYFILRTRCSMAGEWVRARDVLEEAERAMLDTSIKFCQEHTLGTARESLSPWLNARYDDVSRMTDDEVSDVLDSLIGKSVRVMTVFAF